MADAKSHRLGGQRQDLRKSRSLPARRYPGRRLAGSLHRDVFVALSRQAARGSRHDHARRLRPYQASPAGLSRHGVTGRRRDVPRDSGFSGRPVLRRFGEALMAITDQHGVVAPVNRSADRAYLAWATVAVAYAIAFLQRVSPQSVSLSFMADFSTDAAGVAMLASSYFWGYTLMQIPAGLLVDRYGVKRVVLFSMAASSLGSAAFALAPNLLDVFAARLIVACGDALVFTALLKLVALSFKDERFVIMSGISQVSGYVGGVMATTPLAAAVTGFGWRACFVFIACVGVANLAFASLALKPDPVARSAKTLGGVLAASRQSLSQLANWGCAMSFASHFAVVTTLSGVWGIPMLAHFFNISPSAASTPLLAFMICNAIGSIVLGHLADRAAAALYAALVRICLLRMILIAMLLPPFAHALGFLYFTLIFSSLGLVAGGEGPS